jgi:hypothetical protein
VSFADVLNTREHFSICLNTNPNFYMRFLFIAHQGNLELVSVDVEVAVVCLLMTISSRKWNQSDMPYD